MHQVSFVSWKWKNVSVEGRGKETFILLYLLHVITFFLYFCSLTSTVFVKHNVMTINLVKKYFETYSAENVGWPKCNKWQPGTLMEGRHVLDAKGQQRGFGRSGFTSRGYWVLYGMLSKSLKHGLFPQHLELFNPWQLLKMTFHKLQAVPLCFS